jgi:hypothetical protein
VGYAVYGAASTSRALDDRVAALARQNNGLRQEVADRQMEIAQAQTRGWLEEEARRLGYILPGEHVYVLASPGASVPPGGGVDVKQLPVYTASPPVPSSSSTAGASTPTGPTPTPSPTPFLITLPQPSR